MTKDALTFAGLNKEMVNTKGCQSRIIALRQTHGYASTFEASTPAGLVTGVQSEITVRQDHHTGWQQRHDWSRGQGWLVIEGDRPQRLRARLIDPDGHWVGANESSYRSERMFLRIGSTLVLLKPMRCSLTTKANCVSAQ